MKYTKYGPKGHYSPTVGDPCTVCGKPLAPGDYTTLVKGLTDGKFADNGAEVHWACAVPDLDE